jgi:hypothetical protein
MPKRIQLPDDFYKHDFKQLAKVEKHPRTRIGGQGTTKTKCGEIAKCHVFNSVIYFSVLYLTSFPILQFSIGIKINY